MKKCPLCAEEIQDDAIKCRFCNEILIGNPLLKQNEKKAPWYTSGVTIWLSFIFFLPISIFWCIPLVWLNPVYSQTKKIVYTVIMVILSIMALQMLQSAMQYLQQYYGMMLQGTGISM